MNRAYKKLSEIWSQCSIQDNSALRNIIELLRSNSISLRQKDGELVQINLSIPESIEHAYVIGLRYRKNDGTFTEDHFLCEKSGDGVSKTEIIFHRGRALEYKIPEYKGTHKQAVDLTSTPSSRGVTDVSTHSFVVVNNPRKA
jgi:hypothetical protein